MGKPTKSSYKIDVYEYTGDGVDGFWVIEKDPVNGSAIKMYWVGKNDTASSIRDMETDIDFYKALKELKLKSGLPPVDQGINVNMGTDQDPQQATQFEAPYLTDVQVLDLALDFDPVDFCQKLGVLRVAKRFLQLLSITWQQTKDIYIYLGLNGKAVDTQVQVELNYLTSNNVITAADEAGFWADWANAGL